MTEKKNKKHAGRPPTSKYIGEIIGEKGDFDTSVRIPIHRRVVEKIQDVNTGGTVTGFIRDAIAEKLERELKPYEPNSAFPAGKITAPKVEGDKDE